MMPDKIIITITRDKDYYYKDSLAKLSLGITVLIALFLFANLDKWAYLLAPLSQPVQSFADWIYKSSPIWGLPILLFLGIVVPVFALFGVWIVIGVSLRVIIWQLYRKHRVAKDNQS